MEDFNIDDIKAYTKTRTKNFKRLFEEKNTMTDLIVLSSYSFILKDMANNFGIESKELDNLIKDIRDSQEAMCIAAEATK